MYVIASSKLEFLYDFLFGNSSYIPAYCSCIMDADPEHLQVFNSSQKNLVSLYLAWHLFLLALPVLILLPLH